MKKKLYMFAVFIAGLVTGGNIAILKPNPTYEASWLNVLMALGFGLLFYSLTLHEKGE